ncbi:MAG: AraC family transcriptional regulator [Nitrospira sp.]
MAHLATVETTLSNISRIAIGDKKSGLSFHQNIERSEQFRFTILRPTSTDRIGPGRTAQTPQPLTERIRAFVEGNLKNRVTLKELASFLGYSVKYSSEFFQLHMGMCFSQYVKHLRIKTAARMLTREGGSVTHIAEALGFSDSFAFSHFFKRAVGCSPTTFRKQQLDLASLR